MKLEYGKYYKDRNGGIHGPLERTDERRPHAPTHPFQYRAFTWREDGLWSDPTNPAEFDLVVEVPSATEPPKSVLQEAQDIIHGARRQSYGHPRKNFDDTAKMWSVLLDKPITPRQVVQCMIALKLCRDMKKAGRDNLVDIAGYAGCAELIEEVDHANPAAV